MTRHIQWLLSFAANLPISWPSENTYQLQNVLFTVLFVMQLQAKGSINAVLHTIRHGNRQSKMITAQQLTRRFEKGLSLEFHLTLLGTPNGQFVLRPHPH